MLVRSSNTTILKSSTFLPQSEPYTNDRGWVRLRGTDDDNLRLVRLRRDSDTAEEGVFTCDIPGDYNPGYLGVYYPSQSLYTGLICIHTCIYLIITLWGVVCG